MTAFMTTLEGVMEEESVKRSESGPNVLELISCIRETSHNNDTRDLVVKLCDCINTYIDAGNRCKLPSALQKKSGLHFMNLC